MSDIDMTLGAGRRDDGRLALFAEDFDLPRSMLDIPEPEVIPTGFSAADIAAARAEAWAEGFEAGGAEVRTSAARETSALLDQVTTTLRETRDDLVASVEQMAEAIARTLLDSLGAVMPALRARYGEDELRAVVRTIVPGLAREPSVTMRVNPTHVPALRRELDQLDPELMELVHLVPAAAMPVGDVRVSWQDGVAIRDGVELWRQVEAVLLPAGLLTAETARAKELQHAE